MLNRCRANHYNLAASLARINIVEDSTCPCHTAPQDLDHVLWQCPLYDDQRKDFVNKLRKLGIPLPSWSRCLLIETNLRVYKTLCKFFRDCKLEI